MFILRVTPVTALLKKALQTGHLIAIIGLTLTPLSTADMRLLSDSELDQTVAQASSVRVPFSINTYRDSIQLKSLEEANRRLADRLLYFSEIEHDTNIDRERLEQNIEATLVSLSAQVAATAALTPLFPLIGLPLGIGASSIPGAFEVHMSDVRVEVDMTIEFRE